MLKKPKSYRISRNPTKVGINNTVTLYMEDDDEEETYKIVTSIRGNSMKGHISTESLMGEKPCSDIKSERVYIKSQ